MGGDMRVLRCSRSWRFDQCEMRGLTFLGNGTIKMPDIFT
jgi:hypothetical protein